LSRWNGGEDADYRNTIFDDEASTPIRSGWAPFAGTFRPQSPLSKFDGENARGTWTLWVEAWPWSWQGILDGDGFLNAWSLQIEGDGGSPPPPPPPPPPPGNRAPVAGNDSLTGEVNTRLAIDPAQLLLNDTDPDGDVLSITFVGNPTGGAVALGPGPLITFTPTPDFIGQASFQYIVSDGHLTAVGNVSIDVKSVFQWHNSANPVDVNNDSFVAPGDALAIINLINQRGATPLERLSKDVQPELYVDVTADNFVAPDDALAVINHINRYGRQPAAAGEAAGTVHDTALLLLLSEGNSPGGLGTKRRT
jgi:hypothetical protein